MDIEGLVKDFYETVVQESEYREMFETPTHQDITDPYWKAAKLFYDRLSPEQKEALYAIIHQIQVDTVSHVLGILDGTSALKQGSADFELTYKNTGDILNGDLQDFFLAYVEDNQLR